MRPLPAILLLATVPALTGCIGVKVGTREDFFRVKGLANVHASVNGLDEYDGTILDIGILGYARNGEILSVDVGPLAGVGVGIVGARARVLPFDFGVGTLFYDPKPASVRRGRPEEGDPEHGEPGEHHGGQRGDDKSGDDKRGHYGEGNR